MNSKFFEEFEVDLEIEETLLVWELLDKVMVVWGKDRLKRDGSGYVSGMLEFLIMLLQKTAQIDRCQQEEAPNLLP
ncbi:hypothetical protein VNO77_23234 [Canavalia gladiata]|uniref:Uncharacterized protein n=1 Tax=Canavalia gladiata TaxID=3824 RepID=A0AAN9QF68_CANGL